MARDAPHTNIRVAARLANGFALDLVKLGSFGRDVIDALLMAAISQANVAQITRNPELQRLYATLDQPPPDELRRPVSISAIANSLRMPFETARRRITALIDLGIIVTQPRGVVIPTGPLNSPLYRTASARHYELVRNLYFRLRGIGMFEDLPRPTAGVFDPENPPVRLVIRLSSDYVLRLAEPIGQHIGDLVTGLILMDLIHANTEHLPDTEGGEPDVDWTPSGFVPDSARKPVRPSALAERLGMAHETVRRHLTRLLADDRCERNEDGFIVPARVLAREPFVQYMTDNQSHLYRLFAQLAEYGVLSEWERQVLAFRGAA
jgi:hypothetical protein